MYEDLAFLVGVIVGVLILGYVIVRLAWYTDLYNRLASVDKIWSKILPPFDFVLWRFWIWDPVHLMVLGIKLKAKKDFVRKIKDQKTLEIINIFKQASVRKPNHD